MAEEVVNSALRNSDPEAPVWLIVMVSAATLAAVDEALSEGE